MSQPACLSMRVAAMRSAPVSPPGAQSVAETRADMGLRSGQFFFSLPLPGTWLSPHGRMAMAARCGRIWSSRT